MSNSSSSKRMRDNLKVYKESDASFSPIKNEEKNVQCFNYKEESNIKEGEKSILFEEIQLEPDNQLTDKYDENEYDIFAADNEISNVKDDVTVPGDMKEEDQKYSLFEDVKYIVSKEESFEVTDNILYTSECEDEAEQTCSSSNVTSTSSVTDKKTLDTSIFKDIQGTEHYAAIVNNKLDVSENRLKNKFYYCSKALCNGSSLISHNDCECKNELNKCKKCNKAYSSRSSLEAHINICRKEIIKYECNECPKTFYCKDNLQAHIDVAHKGVEKFRCYLCDKVFSRQTFLHLHIKDVHKGYECIICNKKLPTKYHHMNHMRQMHKRITKKYECNYCHKMFYDQYNVLDHITVVHKKIAEEGYHFTEHFLSQMVFENKQV